MSKEMTYRTVEARVKVQAGSDDHARWQVHHALDFDGVMIDGDPAQWLEEILSAVCHNELITGEHIDKAAYLLNYHMDGGYGNGLIVEKVKVKKGGAV